MDSHIGNITNYLKMNKLDVAFGLAYIISAAVLACAWMWIMWAMVN